MCYNEAMESEVSSLNSVLAAAHGLKAPLSTMRQLAFAIQTTDDSAQRDQLCDQIIKLSDRALWQMNDLAKVARLEDGLFTMEPVSVRGICEVVARDLRPFCNYEHKSLRLQYCNRQKLAIANPNLLYSVIYNLCTNATHCSASDTPSVLAIRDFRGAIRIGVRDFGPALPKDIWQQIQHKQLDQFLPISMRPGSSSLGFYIVAKFSQYMHAKFQAVRHRDGTSFYVDLPISGQTCLFGAF